MTLTTGQPNCIGISSSISVIITCPQPSVDVAVPVVAEVVASPHSTVLSLGHVMTGATQHAAKVTVRGCEVHILSSVTVKV